MARVRVAAADLRALGGGAFVRVMYEALKRAGALGSIIRAVRPRHQVDATVLGLVSGQHLSIDIPSDPTGSIDLFSRSIRWTSAPDWHWAIENEASWPRTDWWKIDLRSERRIADVKWTWEAGRHAHLVVLARGVALTGDSVLRQALHDQLRSWLDQNPPEQGVHWYSNLEIALRAFTWAQILELAGNQLDSELRAEMTATLRHAGRHLLVELPYTVSSMRNNHLLGDALGMVVLGELFSSTADGRALKRIGGRLFERQLQRQVHADGSMLEDSLSYHRFVLEMLAARTLLPGPGPTVGDSLLKAAQFLFRLGVDDGPVPQYGDWDEGRVLATAGDRTQLLGSARLALALAGSGAPREWQEAHDEVGWYSSTGEPVAPDPPEAAGHDIGGGMARARHGRFTVWLKAGSQPSHGHADLCSVAIALDGRWLVGDPGTGTYNGPLEQRNYFRSSIAHDVLRVEGLDQLEPHRAFRWRYQARGVVGPPLTTSAGVVMWGAHDAYSRLTPSRRVARVVVVTADLVVVADWVEGPPTSFALSLPLPPSVDSVEASGLFDLPSPPRSTRGREAPYDGWWSWTYGQAEPATRLEVQGVTEGPVVWAVRAGSTITVEAVGDRLVVGDDGFEVEWREAGAVLRHVAFSGDEAFSVLALR